MKLENGEEILHGLGRITCIMNPREKSYLEEGEFDKTGKLIVGRKIDWQGKPSFSPETLGGECWSKYLTAFEGKSRLSSNESILKVLK
jgi:hypothetical protein